MTVPAVGQVSSVRILMRTHLYHHWAKIAFEAETIARGAAKEAAALGTSSDQFGDRLNVELRESMLAICAASFAVDALYGALDPISPIDPKTRDAWSKNRTARHARILETFKAAFDIRAHLHHWSLELEWLFGRRDRAVHFEEGDRSPVPHPAGTNVAAEHEEYSARDARRAVALLVDVMTTIVAHPKTEVPLVVEWAARYRPSIEALTTGWTP